MNPLNLITDSYERPARLYPALLLVAPLIATAVTILSPRLTGLQSIAATVGGCGGAFLLTQLARDTGKKGEKRLFEKWGGLPSVAIFRHRDTRLDSITKARYHKRLAGLVKEAKAPSAEQEIADPRAADAVYAAWSNYLRVNTRDTKNFALLFQENINYGYRRNVWGLRPIGIAFCAASCLACGIRLYAVGHSTGKLDEPVAGAGALAFVLLALWTFRFSADWVRVPADAYATRLAECAESLAGRGASPQK
ncbi:MAG TPA: hypothetical protein VNZ64_08840 [Candidatus Acidoferrum sp.]|jgi:hypothetical protein|nr:hypothetical protein [Candidatus Acidoferrum sp.]